MEKNNTSNRKIYYKPSYIYKGIITRIVDGDTIRVSIDLGFNIWIKDVVIRLARVDSRDDRAAAVIKQYVGNEVLLKVITKDRYGRWIAEVTNIKDQVNLSDHLISLGVVEVYDISKPKEVKTEKSSNGGSS